MNRSYGLISFIFIFALAAVSFAQTDALPPGVTSSFAAQQKSASRADDLYAAGKKAVYDSNWQQALSSFSQIIKLGGARVDEALYWQAYSQNKLGERSEALTSIAQLKREYPRSSWLNDAGALQLEIQQATGHSPNPENQPDCELKLLALNSLMNTEPDRAVPILEKFLNSSGSGACGGNLMDKALFVLAQSNSQQGQNLMMQIATGKLHPELQMRAIHYIGISGNNSELMQIYKSTSSVEAKKTVLHSLGIGGGSAELLTLAKTENNPELVKEAIHSLGIAGGREQLRELYSNSTSQEIKKEILHSTIISGDTELQEKIALGDSDPELKAEAIRDLGISGGSSATLMKIYQTNQNSDVRQSALNALFIKGDAHSLIELAKQETNPEMKKRIVEKLSVMGNREATDYLMELLNK